MSEFYNMLIQISKEYPDRSFFNIDNKSFTYDDVLKDVIFIKEKFESLNILSAKIGVLSRDIYFQICSFIGVLASGNIPILLIMI